MKKRVSYKGREYVVRHAEGTTAKIVSGDGMEIEVPLEELEFLPTLREEIAMKSEEELREMIAKARQERVKMPEKIRKIKERVSKARVSKPRASRFIPDDETL